VTKATPHDTPGPNKPAGDDIAPPCQVTSRSKAPDLRRRHPFKITRLSVHLNDEHDQLLVTLRLPSEALSEVAGTAERVVEAILESRETPAQAPDAWAMQMVPPTGFEPVL
jgi:hypothetical protein